MGRDDVREYVESSDCVLLLGAFMTDINLGVYTARLDLGRSIYATISKDISSAVKLPIASYVGVAYSSYEHRFLPLAGLTINWTNNFSSLVIFDGVKVHPTFSYALGRRHVFTFLLAQGKNPGASYSISF